MMPSYGHILHYKVQQCFQFLLCDKSLFLFASYEPELHPAATYRIKNLKATVQVFSTGSLTVTGMLLSHDHTHTHTHNYLFYLQLEGTQA